jgi:hypothetical protein
LARIHIPRNSTQLISISFLSPSADNGRSSRRLRNTNGPASGLCFLLVIGFSGSCSSILKQSALKLPSLHTSGHMPALKGQFATEWCWNEVGRAGYHSRDKAGIWSKLSKHQSNLTPAQISRIPYTALTLQLLLQP